MDKERVLRLHSSFEQMVHKLPATGTEYWCARDLQLLLGYAQWRNFAKVIDKAIITCQTAGYDPKDHFAGISKMVDLGSGGCSWTRGIVPERLPAAEDVKKVERRLQAEQKKLPQQIEHLDEPPGGE